MSRKSTYQHRFENLFRIAKKVTSSLEIGEILEMIRDETKTTVPGAKEACLLVFDPDASRYTRPLHCAVYKDRINCQLCKRGRGNVQKALSEPQAFQCAYDPDTSSELSKPSDKGICEIAVPICDGAVPLAVLEVIAKEGEQFDEKDMVLLQDLTDLATNALVNARNHWKVSQEKLTVDRILKHLRPFVPETVQKVVEKNPDAPSLQKRDVDLSVLFLDVGGYTRISETLTREKVNFIIEKFFSGFLDIIYEFGGDINETAGDGLMVLFQGDTRTNALNAARASLTINRRAGEINRELSGRFEPIDVNMGINSGVASVGMTRLSGAAGTRMTFTATGTVTNLASRIASAAENSDVLVGPETAHRIEDDLVLYPRGSMQFKNVRERVPVYSLIRP